MVEMDQTGLKQTEWTKIDESGPGLKQTKVDQTGTK